MYVDICTSTKTCYYTHLTLVHVARTLVEVGVGRQVGDDTQHTLLIDLNVGRDLEFNRTGNINHTVAAITHCGINCRNEF